VSIDENKLIDLREYSGLTWREYLLVSKKEVDSAVKERNKRIKDALRQGITLRDIAPLYDVTPSTIMRWVGKRSKRKTLDDDVRS
jgi:aryl-alcohol dehydrogenase-like predicted oxidoreductase